MGLTIDDLLAKEEIREVLFRYCRGIDRLDFDLVESCYHPDAYDDHGTFQGNVPDFVTMCRGFLPRFVCTQHFLGNMLIEVEGDRARAETYAVAYHRKELADGAHMLAKRTLDLAAHLIARDESPAAIERGGRKAHPV